MSFRKQILEYLLQTLKKHWKLDNIKPISCLNCMRNTIKTLLPENESDIVTNNYRVSCFKLCVSLKRLQRDLPRVQIGSAYTYEINCMKYETVVWCNKSVHFNETAHTMKQEICFMKLLIVLCEEMMRNFRHVVHVFRWFKLENYNKLCKIYFLNVHWATNMLHAVYL